MEILKTERLRLRTINEDDAGFYLELLNDPDFIEHIGDRGLRTIEDARRHIADGPVAMQSARGHSLYLVEPLDGGAPLGLSGLIKRDVLEHVDIGYAFLPRARGKGYAFEAARGVVGHAAGLGIRRLAAITNPANHASIQLLTRLGMRFERLATLAPDQDAVNLYLMDLEHGHR